MTVVVSAAVHDGIVFAADSASSLVEIGPSGQIVISNVYSHGNKVFALRKGLPICGMTAGMGAIGTAPIHSLAKDLRVRFTAEGSDWRFDPGSYRIEDIANRARTFFYDERYCRLPEALPAPHSFEFWIGGYSSGSEHPEVWKIAIINGTCDEPTCLKRGGETGLDWGGQPDPIQRLVIGFDATLADALVAAGIDPADLPALLGMVRARSEVPLCHPAMPIQDAIFLADYLVDTAKKFYRFLPGADTVGGATDIATVTRHERFEWIRRKHYYPAALNPLETDHENGQST